MLNPKEAARRINAKDSLSRRDIESFLHGRIAGALLDQFGRFHWVSERTVVGRDPDAADIVILDDSVSRVHAVLRYNHERTLWLMHDARSTNGCFVDGRRSTGAIELSNSQLVIFGEVGFVFFDQEAIATYDLAPGSDTLDGMGASQPVGPSPHSEGTPAR